ncbi:MAG: hypothetical protein IKQ20_03500 [Bacteroidales bacterium]|nr:hypothetical protein [Bacteroidales bacterium]
MSQMQNYNCYSANINEDGDLELILLKPDDEPDIVDYFKHFFATGFFYAGDVSVGDDECIKLVKLNSYA